MKIGVFDSGKGGTTVLQAIQELLPSEEYLYIADSKNCPYGGKSDRELLEITKSNTEKLKKWGAKIIVIACNTATTKCIEVLRRKYTDLVFVGTEPAVKLATKTGAKNILVMATPGTIRSERMMKLLEENKRNTQAIDLLSCPGLADAIENNQDIDVTLGMLLKTLQKDKYQVVVLGCTHYSLIKDEIQKFFPKAKLIDGNDGVARRVKLLVENYVEK